MQNKIAPHTWEKLYQLAGNFFEMAPWTWMLEMDLFGVAPNEDENDVGYCCILGPQRGGGGLAIYKGLKGLVSYETMLESDVDVPGFGVVFQQHCLLLAFLPKDSLSLEERTLVETYCPALPPKHAWPVLRDYTPGWLPWPIQTEEQAHWMKVGIEQAMEVASRFKQDEDLLDHVADNQSLLLVRTNTTPDSWIDTWRPLDEGEYVDRGIHVNRLFLLSNLSDIPRQEDVWLTGWVYFPKPVYEAYDRPFFPLMLVMIDTETRQLLGYELFRPGEEERMIQQAFVRIVREKGYLPSRLLVEDGAFLLPWREIGKAINLRVEMDRQSELIREVKDRLFGSLSV
ncbi:MAG: hypothetical protein AAFQ83_16345 [Bacteroidota bacterium]